MLKRKWYSQKEAAENLGVDENELQQLLLERELGACIVAPFGDYKSDWVGVWKLFSGQNWKELDCSTMHWSYPLISDRKCLVSLSDRLPDDTFPLIGLWRIPHRVVIDLIGRNKSKKITALIPAVPRYFIDPEDGVYRSAFIQTPPSRSMFERTPKWNIAPMSIVIAHDDLERLRTSVGISTPHEPKTFGATAKFPIDEKRIPIHPNTEPSPQKRRARNNLLAILWPLVKVNDFDETTIDTAAKWIAKHKKLADFRPLPDAQIIEKLLQEAWDVKRFDDE